MRDEDLEGLKKIAKDMNIDFNDVFGNRFKKYVPSKPAGHKELREKRKKERQNKKKARNR